MSTSSEPNDTSNRLAVPGISLGHSQNKRDLQLSPSRPVNGAKYFDSDDEDIPARIRPYRSKSPRRTPRKMNGNNNSNIHEEDSESFDNQYDEIDPSDSDSDTKSIASQSSTPPRRAQTLPASAIDGRGSTANRYDGPSGAARLGHKRKREPDEDRQPEYGYYSSPPPYRPRPPPFRPPPNTGHYGEPTHDYYVPGQGNYGKPAQSPFERNPFEPLSQRYSPGLGTGRDYQDPSHFSPAWQYMSQSTPPVPRPLSTDIPLSSSWPSAPYSRSYTPYQATQSPTPFSSLPYYPTTSPLNPAMSDSSMLPEVLRARAKSRPSRDASASKRRRTDTSAPPARRPPAYKSALRSARKYQRKRENEPEPLSFAKTISSKGDSSELNPTKYFLGRRPEVVSSDEDAPNSTPKPKVEKARPPLYGKLSQSEVRLIRILPFCSGPMKLCLVPTPIHGPPPYTALSYAWGDGTDLVEVDVDGHTFQITSNLHEALRVLQTRDRDILCWADALSINQQDQEEVTAQVKLMREIYNTASSVTIWLGNSSNDSDVALELLSSLSKNSSAGNESNLRKLIESPESRQSFAALASLFERNYWRRLWVVQEVLNARHIMVLCGSSSLPWVTYQKATNAIRRLSSHIDQNYSSWLRDGSESLYVSSKSRMSFSEIFLQLGPATFKDVEALLWTDSGSDERADALKFQKALCICRSKFATDARDKVYGLLGVVPEDVMKHLPPDYSLSVKDVFAKATEYIIGATKRLDVLGNAFHFPVHMTPLGLPSWVPDWSHISPMTPIDWPVGRFKAGSNLDSNAILDSQHHQVLSIQTINIDKISHRGIPVGTTNTVDDFIMSFMHWFAMLQGNVPDDASEDQRVRAEESFCRILVLDNVHPLFTAPDVWRQVTFHLFASLARKNLPGLIIDPRLAEYAEEGCVDLLGVTHNAIIQESFSPGMTGRSFFLTKAGIMGMGSGYLASGDLAVVPFGCSTPLLLRSDGEHGEYRLVSDAYLDGYMYGRAITEWEAGKCKGERFNIH